MYGSWIYNYICNRCQSPQTWVRIPPRRNILDTTLCDKVCQWLVVVLWFSQGTPVSSTKKIDRHDITEILKEVDFAISQASITYWKLKKTLKVDHLKFIYKVRGHKRLVESNFFLFRSYVPSFGIDPTKKKHWQFLLLIGLNFKNLIFWKHTSPNEFLFGTNNVYRNYYFVNPITIRSWPWRSLQTYIWNQKNNICDLKQL